MTDKDMLAEVANMVGAPTMHYASDKQVRLELEDRLRRISAKIVEHFKLEPKPVDPDATRQNPGVREILGGEFRPENQWRRMGI
jgi:hypothetical protein